MRGTERDLLTTLKYSNLDEFHMGLQIVVIKLSKFIGKLSKSVEGNLFVKMPIQEDASRSNQDACYQVRVREALSFAVANRTITATRHSGESGLGWLQ